MTSELSTSPKQQPPVRSFLQALKSRYGAEDDFNSYDSSAFLVADPKQMKAGARNKTWELVGMEKTRAQQARFDRLFEVVLRDENITVALTDDEAKKTFCHPHHIPKAKQHHPSSSEDTTAETPDASSKPRYNALEAENMARLEELDLSANVRFPLCEVGQLIPYFANLRVLQLSDMPHFLPPVLPALRKRHQDSSAVIEPLLNSPRLEKLVLNNIGLQSLAPLLLWIEVPQMKELHLDNNGLSTLSLFHAASDFDGMERGEEHEALQKVFLSVLQQRRLAEDHSEATNTSNATSTLFAYPSVKTLSLAQNLFHSWDNRTFTSSSFSAAHRATSSDAEEESLGAMLYRLFPNVEALFLTANALPDLPSPDPSFASSPAGDEAAAAVVFPPTHFRFLRALRLLCLRENPHITSTATVDAIRYLCPHLKTFRISYASLLPDWNETLARMFVVASLPTITTLNRGAVRKKEQLDSEIFYIQRGRREQELQKERAAAGAAHDNGESKSSGSPSRPAYPLLAALEEKHKDLVLSMFSDSATAMTALGEDGQPMAGGHLLLQVTLYPENLYVKNSSKSNNTLHAVQKTLPSTLTIAKLKALVRVLFAVEPQHQQLRYQPGGDSGVMDLPIALENERETLGYYGVTNGGQIGVTDLSLR